MTGQVTALGLFSGGLDSILACRVVADLGVRVIALKFVTPFFDHDLLHRPEEYTREMAEKYGLEVALVDLSEGYLEMLDRPVHGFGKHFNPCIDCKILMLTRARQRMAVLGASFLVTGEVLGQRPMSQRRDTMRVIERDSDCEDILLRPLSARLMRPTRPEREGLIDRERLLAISGRGRKQQKALAASLGIVDYPTPAGGCLLTDPNLAGRIRYFHEGLFPQVTRRSADDYRWRLAHRRPQRAGKRAVGRAARPGGLDPALGRSARSARAGAFRPGQPGRLRPRGRDPAAPGRYHHPLRQEGRWGHAPGRGAGRPGRRRNPHRPVHGPCRR
jgi:tRNA U34 2-thiouridine synthase MnmA/TrmU